MTIGIAISGPYALPAICTTIEFAEQICTGALGGFVTLAWINEQGNAEYLCGQRGGISALIGKIEARQAQWWTRPSITRAALITSGPDRPEPLAQFLTTGNKGELVTGHRMPHKGAPGALPLNQQLLILLRQGLSAAESIPKILSANPTLDAGLIALDRDGNIALGNTLRVAHRKDIGSCHRCFSWHHGDASIEVQIGLLHNALHPHSGLAELLGQYAQNLILDHAAPVMTLKCEAGIPVTIGDIDAVHCDGIDGKILLIETTSPELMQNQETIECALLGPEAKVLLGKHTIGTMLDGPFSVVTRKRLIRFDGAETGKLTYRPGITLQHVPIDSTMSPK